MNPYVQRAIEKERRRLAAEGARDKMLSIETVDQLVIMGGYRGLALNQLDRLGYGSKASKFYQVGGYASSATVR